MISLEKKLPGTEKPICFSILHYNFLKKVWEIIFFIIILQNDPIKLGKGLFACPFCNQTMPHLASMKRHIMTHTGEKPFSCEFCDYSCIQKTALNSHILKNHWNTYILFYKDSKINYLFFFFASIFLSWLFYRIPMIQLECPVCTKFFQHILRICTILKFFPDMHIFFSLFANKNFVLIIFCRLIPLLWLMAALIQSKSNLQLMANLNFGVR